MASDPLSPEQIAEALRLDKLYRHHKAGGKRLNWPGANLRGADLRFANLSGANLRFANLSGANLRSADLDFASWPLHCGGTRAKLDVRSSLQLIYHAFNQDHQDPEIRAALEAIRPLAQRFIDKHRSDATPLRVD